MRILYHHRTLGEGGEGIHIAGMIDAFRKLGHEVEILALVAAQGANDRAAHTPRRRRIGKLLQRMPRAFYELGELGYNVKGYLDTVRVIRRFRPDFIYDRYNLFNVSVVAAGRRSGVPVFLEVNTPYAYQRSTYERLAFRRFAGWLETKTWSLADQVLVVSSPLRDYLLRAGIPAARVEVLPNGVDLDLFDPDAAPQAGNGDGAVIGFVGSLRRWHGVDLLLDAAAPLVRAGSARVVVVGHGETRADLERQAATLGIAPRVEFLGQVSRDAIRDGVARFDVAVSPKSVFYQSPMKVVEYMAMRKPVVAPDKGNIRDLVEHGSEGLLFEEDDPASLRAALERLVGDLELRRRLGERAREKVERRLNWVGNARRVLELHAALRRPPFGSAS